MKNHQWLESAIAELADDPLAAWDTYPCLIWPFAQQGKGYGRGKGYGVVQHKGVRIGAHRAAWIISHGPIPDGMFVCHRCDVRSCVRPSHLFLGTCAENLKDCSTKGRMHPGEANPGAKLTIEQVREIRRRLESGESQRSIARSFDIHFNAIWKIANGKKWKSVE